jgi:hypothetical protein
MLKLTYTEAGLHLECIAGSIEKIVARRSVLALRIGQSFLVQPGGASFLAPIDCVSLKAFKQAVRGESSRSIDLCKVDDEYYEVSLRGTWMASSREAHEGMFLTVMNEPTERFVQKLWETTQTKFQKTLDTTNTTM